MGEPIHYDKTNELCELIDRIASYSDADEGGEGDGRAAGVTRLVYSRAWKEAQSFLAMEMEAAGLSVRWDKVGNLIGRLEGSDPHVPVVLTGSHIDTVRSGGKLDGAYGIAGAIAALRLLKETRGTPAHPIEVVSFCEEEGSRFPIAYWGSGNVTGLFEWDGGHEYRDASQTTLAAAMESAGFGREDQPDSLRSDLGAFVELHIEQGVLLERLAKQIGIVEAIVGQRRYAVSLQGAANHAGTTPMPMRADALAGAAEMIVRLEALAARHASLVATVGRLNTVPNTPNVIPGAVEFTVDVRHDNEDTLSWFCDYLFQEYAEIASRRGLKISVTPWLETKPVPMNRTLAMHIEDVCEALSLSSRRMPSGAGHDAQLFAPRCPTAMIFVPSRGGISHSPDEYTSPQQLADGVSVLASLLYELAYERKRL